MAGAAAGACPAQAQEQDFGPLVTQGQQTLADMWTELRQKRAQLTAAQLQSTIDTATILALRTQVAALQAQLAAVPPCPPVVICTVCPAPVVCPIPVPPPVVTPPPPLPTGSAVLVWEAVAGATGYRVYYGTSPGKYLQVLGAGVAVLGTSFTVSGLTSGIRYYFVVTATNATSESGFSNEVFKDMGAIVPPPTADTLPPSVPTGLAAMVISGTQINLAWNASTDNVGVVSYQVYENGVRIATVAGTSFQHTGRVPGTTYSYRVSAADAVPNFSAWTDPPVVVTTPVSVPVPVGTSPAGTKMPPAAQIIDGTGAVWTPALQTGGLASQIGLLRNGVRVANSVDFLLWTGTTIYLSDFGSGSGWQKWDGFNFVDTTAP